MIKIKYSSRYLSSRKKLIKNNPVFLSETIKTISLFTKNPKHPGLNLEKLKGSNIWSLRVDIRNRIFFLWEKENVALFISEA
ncbi:hypothetical protein A3C59_03550 [Candidatus Daviesbacteria bacterium RIFCSPHIGHO2_02_FULL_36_13]|uniref:Toxin YoeB n=1 Tax=Candidatus Daviesbacteria bacterium RIFCSPHIGHO2_02_FULL_36_13 TaxID=1797768 RepID=A0A1F5JQ14_9BACT|nr:MAG: hypothetical protein A3C59_03550 [Candidatus Daviesbacteria bacterium RIFCSPHIGHO2_02_FULL_36_13]OGE43727.1 MAG: hypothetical protein A3A45_02450 [Candidatus Daviesbacteria bacterium RIFCSPLOWO2_01_FULL_36_8]